MRRAIKSSEATTYEAPTSDHRRFKLLFEREIFKEASIPLTKNIASGLTIIRPRTQQPSGGVHEASEEIYYVLSGKGRLKLDDELIELEKGTAAYIGYGVDHQLFNTGEEDLVLFWVNVPPLDDYKPITEKWKQV